MKIQLDWLNEYVDHGLSAEELSHRLTMGGLELEGLERVDLGDGRLTEVMELNVTPNRGYCLSHMGVAREVGALTGKTCQWPETNDALERAMGSTPVEKSITVVNEEDDLCPRYTARVIENVKPGPSPQWLIDRLTAVGLRPINNIVDITNFVLMEYGQPLHAFDAALLEGSKIVIRRAKKGEAFSALDGTELKLDPDALVIADAKKAVALAGIMGGANSQVTLETRTVVLESAYFDPIAVRKGSKKYGLRSDSSYRFERGVDIETVVTASARAALLIQELAGGEICQGQVDVYPHPREKARIPLRIDRTNQILGVQLKPDQILGYLKSLGMDVVPKSQGKEYIIEVPHSRPTLQREIDLIEEVARLHGYGEVPVTDPVASLQPVYPTPLQTAIREAKSFLEHNGVMETVNYSFVETEYCEEFLSGIGGDSSRVIPLENPISSELGAMRTSLLPGLIKTAVRNLNRGQKSVRLFEQGNIFFMKPEESVATQISCLAGLAVGPYEDSPWKESGQSHEFFDLKGWVESLLERWQVTLEVRPAKRPILDGGQSIECFSGDIWLGYCGQLAPSIARKMEMEKKAFIFELNLEAVLEAVPGKPRFQTIPKYPETFRDISLLVDKKIKAQTIRHLIRETSGPLVRRVDLYDQFEGKKLESGKKSLTFALAFQSPEKTLTDEEVNPVFEKIVSTLSRELGAKLRD